MFWTDRRRLRRAEKSCRLDEVRSLREEFDIEGPQLPDGASSAAVAIESSRRFWLLYALGWAFALVILLIFGSKGIFWIIGAFAAGLAVGGLHAASWWGRICFDGPRLWTGGIGGGWTGPTDLRAVRGYTESTFRQGQLEVVLLTPDPAGRVKQVGGMKFSREVVDRLSPRGPFAGQRIRVGDLVSKEGLGEHLLRYLDRVQCEFGGGQLWKAVEKARKRRAEQD